MSYIYTPSCKLICIKLNISQLCPATVHTDTMLSSQFVALRGSLLYFKSSISKCVTKMKTIISGQYSDVFNYHHSFSVWLMCPRTFILTALRRPHFSLPGPINIKIIFMTHPALHKFSSNEMLSRMSKPLPQFICLATESQLKPIEIYEIETKKRQNCFFK